MHIAHAWQAIGESAMGGAFIHTPEAKIVAYVEQLRRRQETILNERMRGITGTLGLTAAEYRNPQMYLVKD